MSGSGKYIPPGKRAAAAVEAVDYPAKVAVIVYNYDEKKIMLIREGNYGIDPIRPYIGNEVVPGVKIKEEDKKREVKALGEIVADILRRAPFNTLADSVGLLNEYETRFTDLWNDETYDRTKDRIDAVYDIIHDLLPMIPVEERNRINITLTDGQIRIYNNSEAYGFVKGCVDDIDMPCEFLYNSIFINDSVSRDESINQVSIAKIPDIPEIPIDYTTICKRAIIREFREEVGYLLRQDNINIHSTKVGLANFGFYQCNSAEANEITNKYIEHRKFVEARELCWVSITKLHQMRNNNLLNSLTNKIFDNLRSKCTDLGSSLRKKPNTSLTAHIENQYMGIIYKVFYNEAAKMKNSFVFNTGNFVKIREEKGIVDVPGEVICNLENIPEANVSVQENFCEYINRILKNLESSGGGASAGAGSSSREKYLKYKIKYLELKKIDAQNIK